MALRTMSPALTVELTSSQTELICMCAVLAVMLPLLLHLHFDYLAFLKLGPGGTPATIAGYFRVKLLSCFALKNPYTAGPVPARFVGQVGWLKSLPKRGSQRPVTKGIAPHRQMTHKAGREHYEALAGAIKKMAEANENLFLGISCFEKNGTALFTRSPAKLTCRGEVCHAHPSDGSMHMNLHPADARIVLEAGWAERHPLARGGFFARFVPSTFLMVYAPTTEEQLKTVLEIVKAAAWYVSGGDGVTDAGLEKGVAECESKEEPAWWVMKCERGASQSTTVLNGRRKGVQLDEGSRLSRLRH